MQWWADYLDGRKVSSVVPFLSGPPEQPRHQRQPAARQTGRAAFCACAGHDMYQRGIYAQNRQIDPFRPVLGCFINRVPTIPRERRGTTGTLAGPSEEKGKNRLLNPDGNPFGNLNRNLYIYE